MLLPVVLMMGKALCEIFIDDESNLLRATFGILGTPLIALLVAVIGAYLTLSGIRPRAGMALEQTQFSRISGAGSARGTA